MPSGKYNTEQKQIYFKAYDDLSKLENALKQIIEELTSQLQISILGKVAQFQNDNHIVTDTDVMNTYWKDRFGETVEFGIFQNPESGSVFIVGSLVSTFLHQINGKSLATFSSGPYGILRGIGVSENQATSYLKLLTNGAYILILRGFENKLQELDQKLNGLLSS